MKGQVKLFGIQRGFGFITGEDGQDYFVHYSDVLNDNGRKGLVLDKGQEVEFNPSVTDKGLKAIEVKLLRSV